MKHLFRITYLIIFSFLAGCYFPNNFALDLRINSQGRFALQYVGELLADSLMPGSSTQNDDKPSDYIRDLRRISGFNKIIYKGSGVFDVSFLTRGDLRSIKFYTFLTRSNRFVSMQLVNPKEIVVLGNLIPKNFRKKFQNIRGVVRIWTNAHVIYTNADRVVNGDTTRYEWDISSSITQAPKMIIEATP